MYATVKAGTTVRWTLSVHDERTLISEISGLFGGPVSSTSPYVEYTFKEAGTFWYGFKEMPGYRASITVVP